MLGSWRKLTFFHVEPIEPPSESRHIGAMVAITRERWVEAETSVSLNRALKERKRGGLQR